MIFTYVKNINKSQLEDELRTAKLFNLIDSIEVNGNILTITINNRLNEQKLNKLYEVVTNHTAPTLNEERIKEKITSAIEFGQSIIIEVGVENIMRGFSTQQVSLVLYKFAGIKAMLESGSLYTALDALKKIQPDELITKDRLDRVIKKIKNYLEIDV